MFLSCKYLFLFTINGIQQNNIDAGINCLIPFNIHVKFAVDTNKNELNSNIGEYLYKGNIVAIPQTKAIINKNAWKSELINVLNITFKYKINICEVHPWKS